MSKEKQIEEMAELICDNKDDNGICSTDGCRCNYNCEYKYSAEALYEQGYRKQSVGEWLLIKVPTGVEAFGIREVQAYPKCSMCGYMGDVSEWHFKYCPMCGARMKGGE